MWDWITAPTTWSWFMEPFEGQNWWQILNAGFIGTAISSVVGIFVARNVGEVAHERKLDTEVRQNAQRSESRARDALGAVDDDEPVAVNAGPEVAPQSQPAQFDDAAKATFTTASTSIRRLKDYVDALADRCRDGRTRRKYDNISRRDYRIITTAIGEDGGLKTPHLEKLLGAFEEWRTYRNGRVVVPPAVASKLQDLASRYRVTTTSPAKWKPERAQVVQF